VASRKDSIRPLIDAREHTLYCGASMTGKTTLARLHAQQLSAAGYDLVIYDPVGTETASGYWPDGSEVIEDRERFLRYLRDVRSDDPERPIFVFVDEAADIFDHSQRDARSIPRRCRHDGVYLRLIVQRPMMMHPDARTQCSIGFMFRLARNDANLICADFGHGAEVSGEQLDKGEFILLESGSAKVSRHSLSQYVPGFSKPSQE